VVEVHDVFFKDEAFQALEAEPDLLVVGVPLKVIKLLLTNANHQPIDLLFKDVFSTNQHFPISNHEYRDVLSGIGRLVEVDLEGTVESAAYLNLNVTL
jgi:hypothetical protein